MTGDENQTGDDGVLTDADRDSLHVLPLCILPLETRAIQHARVIKNAKHEGVIELYNNENGGSGQISIEDLRFEMGWPQSPMHPDYALLRRVTQLPSYDVYSLRIALRQMEVPVNHADGLKLSPNCVSQLSGYMSKFTLPLIREVYGSDDVAVQGFEGILSLFKSPNLAEARNRLQSLADRLEIQIIEIPRFLENYGDLFLAASYYRHCLNQIMPSVTELLNGMRALRQSPVWQADPNLSKTGHAMVSKIGELTRSCRLCLEGFDKSTDDLWDDLSAEKFRAITDLVQAYSAALGGALCFLSVKVDAWTNRFPRPETSTPERRAQFLMSDMRQGFDTIDSIDLTPLHANLERWTAIDVKRTAGKPSEEKALQPAS